MAMVMAAFIISGFLCTSSQHIYVEENNLCDRNEEAMMLIRKLLIQQGWIQESLDSLRQTLKRLEKNITSIREDVQIVKRESSAICPPGWFHHGNSCYLFSSDTLPWNESSDTCSSIGDGLVAIESQSEETFLQNRLHYEF
ncbi:oxidized low-density lipoprotein receptor 1-like, partial [Saccostrea cucullata]|uniref:oxidized low-density lipoprotein receptor 1-like n=1 Tax=Saccostrea cuccullata TaxID=36930 RepID=UPI002ED557D5